MANSVDARRARRDEGEITSGNTVQATDAMTYDAETDTPVDGAWACACWPGS